MLVPDLAGGNPAVVGVSDHADAVGVLDDDLHLAVAVGIDRDWVLVEGAGCLGVVDEAGRAVVSGEDPEVLLARIDHLGVAVSFKVVHARGGHV